MDYIIERKDSDKIAEEKHWLLIYGRRKLGKTFLLRNICKFENYYSVKSDNSIISRSAIISIDDMAKEVKRLLLAGRTVVIDEFQRLNTGVLEELSILHPQGRLILSGSSLRVIKKVFEPQSPLLGFFSPLKIGLISPIDAFLALSKDFSEEKTIELSTFLREPWIIPIYNKEETLNFIYKLVTQSKQIITSLIGEVFTEEERELTKKYGALLSLIGSGIWNIKELTSIMYSRKLIPEPSQTHIIQYLKNLEEIELVERIKLNKSKGGYYRLFSPLMNIYYYLDSRYDISSREISLEEIKPTLQKLINFEIQNYMADLFSELFEGRKEYFISPDKEVDFIITKRNKNEIVGEVKWKKVGREDLNRFKINSENLFGKKILLCKGSSIEKADEAEIITPKKLADLIKNKSKK